MAIALRSTSILNTNSLCLSPPIRSRNLSPQSVQLPQYGLFPSLLISHKLNIRNEHTFQFMTPLIWPFLLDADAAWAEVLHKEGVLVTEIDHIVQEIRTFLDKRDGKLHNDEPIINTYDVVIINSPRGVGKEIDWLWVAEENKDALVVVDPQDYFSLIAYLEEDLEDNKFRRILDLKVSKYEDDRFSSNHLTEAKRSFRGYDRSIATAIQHHGNEMSSKSYLDANVAWNWVSNFVDPTCVVMSCMFPCGAVSRDDILEAHKLVGGSHFCGPLGRVVTFNVEVDETLAWQIREFLFPLEEKIIDHEVVVAPSYTEKALEILCGSSKELTVLEAKKNKKKADEQCVDDIRFRCVSEKCPTKMELDDVKFAWLCVKHSGTNFVVAKNKFMLGWGTWGEINPLEYGLKQAIGDSGKEAKGAVLASDVFFPSDRIDLIEEACKRGVSVIVGCSGGRIGDKKAIECCNKHDVSLLFAQQ